ncbi:SprT-like family-domain-containing protein [Talaromyces proteolyticus]|uniref:SprT-like family-domain-containing protein n=1 Tax=Talaromyces proteolyticus TaxID=1131652 RepID=A0AAD4KWZ1_9EURO|nr:SprT-like family-domain-containing protein [Talaromyces proteolyticus]KAH8701851.1 SprT-like family-domain-containing protein [Talaromyces proteolyticus]
MARLNASNPTVRAGRASPTKTSSSSFSMTINSPLRPKLQKKKKSSSTEFKIFEDEQSADDEQIQESYTTEPIQTARPMAPLKLAHTNSITSGLSKRASQGSSGSDSNRSSGSFEDEESSDKENIFIEDEAEETSEEEEEEEGEGEEQEEEEEEEGEEDNQPEEESNLEGYAEREEFDSPRQLSVNTRKPKFMRYRDTELEAESDTQSECSSDEEDGHGSLDDFIVSDNEDISYYESEPNDLSEDDDEEQNEEVKAPSPKPVRRRLLRGRKPRTSSIKLEELNISENHHFTDSPKISTPRRSMNTRSPAHISPCSPQLLSDGNSNEKEAKSKVEKVKRSPLRESINSLPSISDSPTKKRLDRKLETPPPSPSKIALPSPSKTNYRIPPSPHRQSSDAFWSQEVTNAWNDQWSPQKQRPKGRALERLLAVVENDLDDDSDANYVLSKEANSPTQEKPAKTKTPSKTALKKAEVALRKKAAARKKAFDERKTTIAHDFLITVDEMVSGGQVKSLAEKTGGIKITWSKTLRNTAGRANWKQERINQAGRKTEYIHHASINLAEHIIDDEDRLLNTLAHEYCHLANFMISGVRNQPHGASFKTWGQKCTDAVRKHPEYRKFPVEVTTKHSYKIDYKYVWICVDCGHEYGRHSKSIDPTKCRCSICKGGLQQIKPKPRNMSPKKNFFSKPQQSEEVTTSNESTLVDDMIQSVGNVSLA